MRPELIMLLCLAIFIGMGVAHSRENYRKRGKDKLKVGDDAPDFKLTSLDGKTTITLSDYEGDKPVVLIFGSYT